MDIVAIDGSFGPRPLVLPFKYGAVVIHVPWLLALILIGAGQFRCRRFCRSNAQLEGGSFRRLGKGEEISPAESSREEGNLPITP